MKHALIATTFALAVLVTPAAFAQEAVAPEAPSVEAALELPEAAASTLPDGCTVPDSSLAQAPLAQADPCEAQCRVEYQECLIICSKNPCFVSCETVLELCLENCNT